MITTRTPAASASVMALPVATLALAIWQAVPALVEAWQDDLYARGAPLAFVIWLGLFALYFLRIRERILTPRTEWIAVSLFLCAAGSMSGLRVLQHLALAAAIPGLLGLRFTGFIAVASAVTWLPASGWFLSHWQAGGLLGWERPLLSLLTGAVLIALPGILSPYPPSSTP